MSSTQAASIPVEPDLDAQIGRRVHQLMWDRQITQTAIGLRVGMDSSSVAKRLRGKLGWNAGQLVSFAAALDTTVAYLVGETEEPATGNDPERPVNDLLPSAHDSITDAVAAVTNLAEYRAQRAEGVA